MTERAPIGWDEFRNAIAGAANVSADVIAQGSRLIEDIGLDSLALAEVVALLLTDLDTPRFAEGLEERTWANVTVGELYDEYRDGSPRASGDHVLRVPKRDRRG